MEKSLVSIVVPIYKVEKYLDRCVESIINQTYRELEIILVDDGSPDRCPAMCEDWAKKDDRIKVVHKKNAGLGMARNTGIEYASGKYIYFVDSDDYIALDTVEKCCQIAEKENADVVTFGFCDVRSDGKIRKTTLPKPEKYIFEGKEVLEVFLPDLLGPDTKSGKVTNLWISACALFCRLEVIKNADWKFVSERDIISEDVFSILCLYREVQRVAVLPETFYFYCENSASLTHSYRKDRYERIKHFYDCCIAKCNELGYPEEVKIRVSYQYLSFTIAALKMIAGADCGKAEKKEAMKAIFKDPHLKNVLYAVDIRKESKNRKILLGTIKHEYYHIAEWIIILKTEMQKRRQ